MQIAPIKGIGFKGQTKYLSCDGSGKYKKVAEYLYGTSSFGSTKGMQNLIKKHSYPYAVIEETIGKFHDDETYKIYFTDPKEVVDKKIKLSHDYIVYDKEPSFPDIQKNFFSPESVNIEKEFQHVIDYYKRLENSSTKTSDTISAKNGQTLAYTCKSIFDESSNLRAEKVELISSIQKKKNKIELINDNVDEYSKKLAIKKASLPRHKKSYLAKCNKLDFWTKKRVDIQNCTPSKIELINNKIQQYTILKDALGVKINKYEERMLFWENYLKNAPAKIAECIEKIIKMQKRLEEIEQELKPNYDKLCKFYTKNGIQIFKKL